MTAQTTIPQGQLNRLLASVVIDAFPELNVISGYLGTEAIRLALETNATDLLNTMTGMVSSPTPYQACTISMAIVKSTPLAGLYQAQFQDTTILGQVTIFPDANTLNPFVVQNVALENIREMGFGGTEPSILVTMRGYMPVNQGFFS